MMLSFLYQTIVSVVLATPGSPLFSERIEVRVGNQIVTTSEIESQMRAIRQEQANRPDALAGQDLVNAAKMALTNEKLILDSIQREGTAVTDQDVERRLNLIRVSQGFESMDAFGRVLESQGMSLNDFRRQVRRQMEMEQFQNLVQAQVSKEVSPEEARSFYQNNPARFESQFEVDVQECLIPYQNSRSEIESLVQSFKKRGSNFEECVQKHSQSPSREFGGILKNIRRGAYMPQVEQVIFSGNTQEVVELEMPGVVRLFKILEKRDLGPRSFEEVREEIERNIVSDRVRRASERMLIRLREDAAIKVTPPSEG
jgi:peptidyl-prolyl cis-trans isomerase SurA